MCGIIGFTGFLNAPDVLINGLRELEYRGYDSAGIACSTQDGIQTIKAVGKVSSLEEKLPKALSASCGIGHTRWATHGNVSEINAHPHKFGKVTLIHNGIIENYLALQWDLEDDTHKPVSQTDSEIAAMLIDKYYNGDPYSAIKKAVNRLEGSYAFCIIFENEPDVIYSIRKGSPLVACSTPDGSIIASDMVALLRYSKDYFVMPEFHIARLTKTSITLTDLDGNLVEPEMLSVSWDVTSAQKNGFKHFMLKEIHEEPEALRRTINPRITKINDTTSDVTYSIPDFSKDKIDDSLFENINRIVITACGTAMHAGLVGRVLFERLLRLPVSVEIASEFRSMDPIIDENTLVITVSQSGETFDTLAALKLAKSYNSKTLSIVNVKGSTIARESDYVFYTHAGPEIAVASTKAYTAQLAAFYLIALRFAYVRKTISTELCSYYIDMLSEAVTAVETMIGKKDLFENISRALCDKKDLFFIGRGIDYALSWEASIKLKEISYIHSEAYAAGELKHGTLSLVTEGVPVIAFLTQKDLLAKMVSNIKEVRARHALVICITTESTNIEEGIYDYRINIPDIDDTFAPFPAAIVLQMIAYFTSLLKGLDVDQPRNLAKSVTVE